MKTLFLTLFLFISSMSFSQDAQKIADIFNECACKEIIMISRGVEKTYTAQAPLGYRKNHFY